MRLSGTCGSLASTTKVHVKVDETVIGGVPTISVHQANRLFCLIQGQVVDRIDHNIESTSLKVEAGLNELKKADQYQKKNRKMKCIVIEAVIVVVLLFILIVFKT